MFFNSIDFAVFLPVFFIFYWFITDKNLKLQNFLIVVASYIFYGWWDWRFLSLIMFSTLVDFFIGIKLKFAQEEKKRKILLLFSLTVNLGFLAVFKYYNFFIDNFVAVFSFFGASIKPNTLNIVLPAGISFYTFQTLSYTIDVYKRKLEPTEDFIAFSAFVSFFPQLVAGPIERATHLLPQFYKKRHFDYVKASDGMRQILWGLFKKVVIADNCAVFADKIFNNSSEMSGSSLLLGAIFFTFQIYCDFSGYSDIATGTAKLFGFDLMQNFAFPYFSRDIAEFWRRWHISLSTWFRDYLYIPLGGSRGGVGKQIRNTFIIFTVSGFWHGANWTFIFWGALNAFYFLPLLLTKNNRRNLDIVAAGKFFPCPKEILQMIITFSMTVFAWIFFRSNDMTHAFRYIVGIFSSSLFQVPQFPERIGAFFTLLLISVFMLTEWVGREEKYALAFIRKIRNKLLRFTVYALIVFSMGMFMPTAESPFIYFQF
ncbi:MAG: membrane-bound O-acyltransferase family protein [Candidatus Cloacimonadota bacterium]|nr:MAG: membrane-bound O-acyltransferase family protein [Candidatus Cloacimonadota bacterium]